jgi:two-component system, cell cycle sensor histidine kinase and response regulator CckA
MMTMTSSFDKRKQAELTSALLSAIIDSSDDAIISKDLNGVITSWNKSAERVFGYTAAEAVGRSITMLIPPDRPDEEPRILEQLKRGERVDHFETIRVRKDGRRLNVSLSISPIKDSDGRIVGASKIARDITERKQAEEALRESQDRFAAIFNQSTGGIAQTDLTGRFVLVNDRYCEIVSRSREELLNLRMQDITHPEDLRVNVEQFRALAEGRGPSFIIEKRYLGPDGSSVWAHNDVAAIRDAEGNVRYIVASVSDITDRKRVQEDLENLNADLEARVADRTAVLRRSITERERLQDQLLQAQKMESIGTLASGVAHDFNNLLNIILSHATIMRLDGKNPASIAECAAVIEETVRRGASLVQQLMSLGRKNETRFEAVRLNGLAEKLANLLTETFTKTVVITLDLEPGLPAIDGDENQLHQTLLNLCVNARDAMPEGGGRISFKTKTVSGSDLRGNIPEAAAERYVCVSVSDNGSGMDDATQRRIFEPFFTTKPVGQGTGLGLAVVYGIVKNHDGFVQVKSKVGRGTTFSIYLPVPSRPVEQTSEAASHDSAVNSAGRGETILFVDDEETQLKAMRRFLESQGYRILSAKDGVQAVETFKQHKDAIAVAVLDLGLPQLGGWQAFQQMREIQPELKALIATGFVSPEVEAELEQGRLCGVILKPYQLDDVLEKISQAIHRTAKSASRHRKPRRATD